MNHYPQKKPIIFVTDDGKKDWWIRDTKGKPIKPLPTLVQEMFVEAGVLLHMYQGYEFLEQAEHFLKLEEKPDIIADAMAVTEQNTVEVYQVKHGTTVRRLQEYYAAENAVKEWIQSTYSQDHEIIVNLMGSPDFIIGSPDFIIVEYNGPRNLDTERGRNKIYSRHDEKTIYSSFQGKSGSGTLERREDLGTNCH